MSTPPYAEQEPIRGILGKFWTVANMLSIIRLILVVPVTYLIIEEGPSGWLWALIGLAIATDWFDGSVARWSKTVSEWGKVLDPLADKVAAASVTLALVVRESLPAWFLVLLVVRDSVIFLGGVVLARRTSQVVMSIWLGKLAVGVLSITIVAALLQADPPIMQGLILATSALLVFSFILYMLRFIRLYRSAGAGTAQMRMEAGRRAHGNQAPEELKAGAYADRT